ncbi:MAG: hypothetical protein ACJ798_01590 [Phenylobacterium sp.]
MRRFTLYGLDEGQRLLAAEHIDADDVPSARLIAAERLAAFPRVELWEASVCIARRSRQQPQSGG